MLFEVGKKGSVREVLEARGIVRHDVGTPWDEEVCLAVAMLPLVGTGIVTEVGGRSVSRYSLLEHPGKGWSVVAPIGDGGIPDVMMMGHERSLGEETGLF